MNLKWCILGPAVALAGVGLFVYAFVWSDTPSEPSPPPVFQTKSILYRFTLRNPSAKPVNDAQFRTLGPVRRSASQTCINIDASLPFTLTGDDLGNQILLFTDLTFAPFQSRTVTVRADLQIASQPLPANAPDTLYLSPGPLVEADHPKIRTAAQTFGANDSSDIAKQIHTWVSSHIRYSGYRKEARGALYALTSRQGDCTEYMDLFAALGRARKIPTRRMAGYLHKSGVQLKPGDFHNWCEFYSQGAWRLADPQQNIFDTHYPHYVALKIIDTDPGGTQAEPPLNRFSITPDVLTVRMEG